MVAALVSSRIARRRWIRPFVRRRLGGWSPAGSWSRCRWWSAAAAGGRAAVVAGLRRSGCERDLRRFDRAGGTGRFGRRRRGRAAGRGRVAGGAAVADGGGGGLGDRRGRHDGPWRVRLGQRRVRRPRRHRARGSPWRRGRSRSSASAARACEAAGSARRRTAGTSPARRPSARRTWRTCAAGLARRHGAGAARWRTPAAGGCSSAEAGGESASSVAIGRPDSSLSRALSAGGGGPAGTRSRGRSAAAARRARAASSSG